MPQVVQGLVACKKGQAVEVVEVAVPDPGVGEVVVNVTSCDVCHTDLTYRDGGISEDYPFLLGHEAAGTVESVGPGVTRVAPGDVVLLCSDGLTEMLPDEAISEIIRSRSDPEQACRQLVAGANDAGGKDNITVVVARFGDIVEAPTR